MAACPACIAAYALAVGFATKPTCQARACLNSSRFGVRFVLPTGSVVGTSIGVCEGCRTALEGRALPEIAARLGPGARFELFALPRPC